MEGTVRIEVREKQQERLRDLVASHAVLRQQAAAAESAAKSAREQEMLVGNTIRQVMMAIIECAGGDLELNYQLVDQAAGIDVVKDGEK